MAERRDDSTRWDAEDPREGFPGTLVACNADRLTAVTVVTHDVTGSDEERLVCGFQVGFCFCNMTGVWSLGRESQHVAIFTLDADVYAPLASSEERAHSMFVWPVWPPRTITCNDDNNDNLENGL